MKIVVYRKYFDEQEDEKINMSKALKIISENYNMTEKEIKEALLGGEVFKTVSAKYWAEEA